MVCAHTIRRASDHRRSDLQSEAGASTTQPVILSGPRRGESIGLEWPDIDLNAGTATIERQRISVIGKVIEDTPKSDAGGRVVALDRGCIDVLRAHRVQQRKDRLVWGEAWVDLGKVFTREDGSALDPE
ncbi:hypothetical protein HQO24_19985 [Rhodococcus fascians]|nr:hypothetical protein [Rhodococcus fascians]MBY4398767.1 hypothetical protein [Rhodococcus fascians]MBY4408129.1 hypothetical protein [Rhodococcus fascians]MBY4423352.1 hypothetical protein [Rhodococcus fascians]MBY4461120.1 hypothetical protein [Rhodococcus fascians]